MRDVAYHCFQHRGQGAELFELPCARSTYFHYDYQCKRPVPSFLLQCEFLWDSVIGQGKIGGGQSKNQIADFVANESGNDDQRGLDTEVRRLNILGSGTLRASHQCLDEKRQSEDQESGLTLHPVAPVIALDKRTLLVGRHLTSVSHPSENRAPAASPLG